MKIQNHSKVIRLNKLHVTDAGVIKDCHTSAIKSVSAKDNLNPFIMTALHAMT
jgi:hypothetical protein